MLPYPEEVAAKAIVEHGQCACRELRGEVIDAVRSSRLDEARTYLDAACLVCGRQPAWQTAAQLGFGD